METRTDSERLVSVETSMKFLIESSTEIKEILKEHVKDDKKWRDAAEKKFAPIEVKENLVALDKEVSDIPDKMRLIFAGIWVENGLKSIAVTVAGSLILAVIYKAFF